MFFVPDWPVIAAFVAAAIVLALTPGPDMTLFLSRAINRGRTAGMVSLAGALLGGLVHTLAAAIGVSALIVASQTGFLILKIVGAGYLAWLAIDAIRNGSALNLKPASAKPSSLTSVFMTGIGVNLLNPKIVLFFMTFLPQFVSATDPHAPAKMIFLGVLFTAIALIICTAMIFAADGVAASLKRNPKVTRAIDWLFAGVFGAFAVKILTAQRV